jgi:hypothetical protein
VFNLRQTPRGFDNVIKWLKPAYRDAVQQCEPVSCMFAVVFVGKTLRKGVEKMWLLINSASQNL